MKLYYTNLDRFIYNEIVDVNSRKETLLYEGERESETEGLAESLRIVETTEYDLINTKNFNNIKEVKEFTELLVKVNPNPEIVIQPFSALDYQIFKESMINSGSAEMDVVLDNFVYKMKFNIVITAEYTDTSTQIGNIDKRLYFVVEKVPLAQEFQNTIPDNTVIYIKKYIYKLLK